jgi:anti-sigma B factor antagonist
MKLSTKEAEGITVVTLEGSVMGGPDAAALNDELHKLIEKHKKKIVLDLSNIRTMNSSGLAMMIEAHKIMKDAGGSLKIAAASKKIESLISMTKLSTIFELYPTVMKATSSFV